MDKIMIRNMQENDLNQVCEIEQQIFSDPWTWQGFATSLKAVYSIYLVAEVEGEIAGYCGLWGIAGEGQINNVATKASFRRMGIGEKMLHQLIVEGRKDGLDTFTLEVRESNQNAIHLYKKLGFQSAGIRKDFYDKPKENAVIMWLEHEEAEYK